MNILILGGTGVIGRALVNELRDQDHRIYITSRSNHEVTETVNYLHGNAKDRDFLGNILLIKKWDIVVDLMNYSTPEFLSNVNELLRKSGRYIFTSSCRVFANSPDPLTEKSLKIIDVIDDQKYFSTDEYALAKGRQEKILEASPFNNWIIARPYITFDTERLQFGPFEKEEWLYRSIQGRKLPIYHQVQSAITTLTPAHIVAKYIASIIADNSIKKTSFNLVANTPLTWEEVHLANVTDNSKKIKVNFHQTDRESFLKLKPTPYQTIYDRVYDRVFDTNKLKAEFDLNARVDIERELSQCFCDFMKSPRFTAINWEFEAKKDVLTGEMARLDEFGSIRNFARYMKHKIYSRKIN